MAAPLTHEVHSSSLLCCGRLAAPPRIIPRRCSSRRRPITVEGVVKEFQFSNPHSWLLVDVTDKNGKVTTWGFEAEGPSTLQRAGIRPSEFRVGTKVTMTGRPMKDGRPAAIWVLAVRGDGKTFDPREGFQVK